MGLGLPGGETNSPSNTDSDCPIGLPVVVCPWALFTTSASRLPLSSAEDDRTYIHTNTPHIVRDQEKAGNMDTMVTCEGGPPLEFGKGGKFPGARSRF